MGKKSGNGVCRSVGAVSILGGFSCMLNHVTKTEADTIITRVSAFSKTWAICKTNIFDVEIAPSDLQTELSLPDFFFPLANGVYLIAIINKTLLHIGNCPIADPIAEIGVAHTHWPKHQFCEIDKYIPNCQFLWNYVHIKKLLRLWLN